MNLNFSSGALRVLKNENGIKLVARKLNQNPLYFLVYKGVTVRMGQYRHINRHFNRYNGALKTLSAGS